MPVQRRALAIALIGPVLQVVGLIWVTLHMLLSHYSGSFTARHLLYEPGVLLAVSGLLVTFACLPVALEVARSSEEDVAIPLYEPTPQAREARVSRRERRAQQR